MYGLCAVGWERSGPSPPRRAHAREHVGDALAREVDGLAEDARRLLRRVEAHRVLRGDKVQSPLRAAVEVLCSAEGFVACAQFARGLERLDQFEHGLLAAAEQGRGSVLDCFDAPLDLGLGVVVAGLAGPCDVGHGVADVVVADLDRPSRL